MLGEVAGVASRQPADGKRPEQRGTELSQLLEALGLLELGPEVPRRLGAGRGAVPATWSTKRSSVPAKSLAQQPIERRVLRGDHRVLEVGVSSIAAIRRATSKGSFVSYSTPPPSIVAGTAVAAKASTGTRLWKPR